MKSTEQINNKIVETTTEAGNIDNLLSNIEEGIALIFSKNKNAMDILFGEELPNKDKGEDDNAETGLFQGWIRRLRNIDYVVSETLKQCDRFRV